MTRFARSGVETVKRIVGRLLMSACMRIAPDAAHETLLRRPVLDRAVEVAPEAVVAALASGLGRSGHVEPFAEVAISDAKMLIALLERLDPARMQRAHTYAQEGEDLILDRLLEGRPPGFFVDIGAHHPFRFSNTYLLYLRGWRGVNVDATPGSMALFERHRPEDVNVEAFVGDPSAERSLTLYNEPALNSASAGVNENRKRLADTYWPAGECRVQPRSLADLLDAHVPEGRGIDFMSIDVEGLELDILASNDWDRYRPDFLLVEVLGADLDATLTDPVTVYLRERGYRPIAKAYNTLVLSRS
jgi:FkbM family methyltransferase